MSLELTAVQTRVLGALVEKELTTPDQYPLTLTALLAACNQKTSREPVMSLVVADVKAALEYLVAGFLVRERNQAGARVPKYGHRLSDSLGLSFSFNRAQLATLAVLMLRGPQTPAEVKSRGERMRGAGANADVANVLESLAGHARGPWVHELLREPGRRESRWAHLLNATVDALTGAPANPSRFLEQEVLDVPFPQAATVLQTIASASFGGSGLAEQHSASVAANSETVLAELRAEIAELRDRIEVLEDLLT